MNYDYFYYYKFKKELLIKKEKKMSKFYVYDPYDGLQEFETLQEAKKYILENCTHEEEGIHPEIESFLILQQTHEVVVVPIDEEEVFEIQFNEINKENSHES